MGNSRAASGVIMAVFSLWKRVAITHAHQRPSNGRLCFQTDVMSTTIGAFTVAANAAFAAATDAD